MVPDGMPLIVTEILLSAGTGSNFSAVGRGAVAGLTSQPVAWLVAGALELTAVVVGVASFALGEHAASEIVAAKLATAITTRFLAFSVMSVPFLVCFWVPRACGIAVIAASEYLARRYRSQIRRIATAELLRCHGALCRCESSGQR
jgi:hypothetical protein